MKVLLWRVVLVDFDGKEIVREWKGFDAMYKEYECEIGKGWYILTWQHKTNE